MVGADNATLNQGGELDVEESGIVEESRRDRSLCVGQELLLEWN